jgi:hypothetical protein
MNVKPAPFALTPATVAALVSDRAGPNADRRVAHVPVVSIRLVDRPRRSEDPRLARANDGERHDAEIRALPSGNGGR